MHICVRKTKQTQENLLTLLVRSTIVYLFIFLNVFKGNDNTFIISNFHITSFPLFLNLQYQQWQKQTTTKGFFIVKSHKLNYFCFYFINGNNDLFRAREEEEENKDDDNQPITKRDLMLFLRQFEMK